MNKFHLLMEHQQRNAKKYINKVFKEEISVKKATKKRAKKAQIICRKTENII